MKIGLIDRDKTNFPNLALMKISAYHKSIGDEVSWYAWYNGHYDKVYVSKVFGNEYRLLWRIRLTKSARKSRRARYDKAG